MSLNLDKSGWTQVTLGDVAIASKDKVDPESGEVDLYVAGEHMDTDDLKVHRWGEVGDGYLGPAFHRRFRSGQVLYGSRRTYLRKVAVAEFDGVTANTTFVVETVNTSVLLQEYLPFVMSAEPFHRFAVQESRGSVNPYVNWSDIARYEFDLPPLEEQKRLADFLWSAEHQKRSIASMQSSLYRTRQAFRTKLIEGVAGAHVPFESVCVIPSQNGLALKKADRAGDIPMVNMGEMFKSEIVAGGPNLERVKLDRADFLLRPGDLLFARRSIVFEGAGQCCLVPDLSENHTFESSVIRVRPNPDMVDAEYLLNFFRSRPGRSLMRQIVRRGPISGISGSDLRKLKVTVPVMPEQQRINAKIKEFESSCSYTESVSKATINLRSMIASSIFASS